MLLKQTRRTEAGLKVFKLTELSMFKCWCDGINGRGLKMKVKESTISEKEEGNGSEPT